MSVTRMASFSAMIASLFSQVLRTIPRTLSVARVDRPAIENRKSGLVGRSGVTRKVISADDQTGRSKRVRHWISDKL